MSGVSDNVGGDGARNDAHSRRNSVEIPPLREQNAALELEVLAVRDWAAAQGIKVGDIRRQLDLAKIDGANHRDHIARLEAALAEASTAARHAGRLRQELEDLKASTTWKTGRVVLSPVRLLKRMLRRG